MYKHYARLNENNIVIKFFSSAFEQPTENDILILEDGMQVTVKDKDGIDNFVTIYTVPRHCHKKAMDEEGIYLYEYKNGKIADRDIVSDVLEKVRKIKINEINTAYNQYILSLYDRDRQGKYQMAFLSYMNKVLIEQIPLTEEEQADKSDMENKHRWYKGMLAKHETDKQYILNETDSEKLKLFKATLE